MEAARMTNGETMPQVMAKSHHLILKEGTAEGLGGGALQQVFGHRTGIPLEQGAHGAFQQKVRLGTGLAQLGMLVQ